jgi:DNA primase
MIDENQRDMENSSHPEDQLTLLQTHQHLKQLEMELTGQIGTVILK